MFSGDLFSSLEGLFSIGDKVVNQDGMKGIIISSNPYQVSYTKNAKEVQYEILDDNGKFIYGKNVWEKLVNNKN